MPLNEKPRFLCFQRLLSKPFHSRAVHGYRRVSLLHNTDLASDVPGSWQLVASFSRFSPTPEQTQQASNVNFNRFCCSPHSFVLLLRRAPSRLERCFANFTRCSLEFQKLNSLLFQLSKCFFHVTSPCVQFHCASKTKNVPYQCSKEKISN